jgi:hypothetical protein
MRKKSWVLVGGVSLGLTLATPARAIDTHWQGGDLQAFSVLGNWQDNHKPGSQDRGINDTTNRIKYDQVSGDEQKSYTEAPYVIDKFWGDGESGFVFEGSTDNGTPRALQVLHGMSDTPPDPNDHEIVLGPREALFVGDAFIPYQGPPPSTYADIVGYAVTADGGNDWAMMSVSQKLGAGTYNLRRTRLGVGYALEQGGHGPNAWEYQFDPFLDMTPLFLTSVIDSDRSLYGAGVSEWVLADSTVYATRAEDLDQWTVEPSVSYNTFIGVHDYMEAYSLLIEETRGSFTTRTLLAWPPSW